MSNTASMTTEKSSITTVEKKKHTTIYLVMAALVTGFLFFIDEGYYSFQWMLDWGSWIIFLVYALSLHMSQYLTHVCIPGRYSLKHKRILACILGIPLGLSVLWLGFSIALQASQFLSS